MTSIVRRSLLLTRGVRRYHKISAFNQSRRESPLPPRPPQRAAPARPLHSSAPLLRLVPFKLSDIGEGIREVVIKEWYVKEGDRVQQFDNICEVQSDKAAVTITSRYDGVVARVHHAVDAVALVGQPLVDIDVDGDAEPAAAEAQSEAKETAAAPAAAGPARAKVLTTPSVRRIASQFQVDLGSVKATGRHGRVLKEDILAHLNISSDASNEVSPAPGAAAPAAPAPAAPAPAAPSAPLVQSALGEDKVVPITGFTRAMVKTMTESLKIPHFGFSDEYDVSALVAARGALRAAAAAAGARLTYMPLIIKAASLSLAQHPLLNSSLDPACENIVYRARHNIGVAMDTPNGLVVPVIKDVQLKSVLSLARELSALQERGAAGRLALADLTGATFTISNIGIVGGTYTMPVISAPQVAIGALGKIQVLPRFDESGAVRAAHVLVASWSADHRVVDGVTMARFSNQLKAYLENPYLMILDA